MSIVTVEELNAHMSSPQWAAQQSQAAQTLLDNIEGALAAALGTYISPSPDPLHERVEVSPTSGLVMLEYPVFEVLEVNGRAPADGDAAPSSWDLRNHRLYSLASGYAVSCSSTAPNTGGWPRAVVRYLPGWGADPALCNAVLERAATVFDNRHDDTITIRDDTPTRNSGSTLKAWLDADTLGALRRFRRVGVLR